MAIFKQKSKTILSPTPVSYDLIRSLRDRLGAILKPYKIDEITTDNIRLTLTEYFTNVLKHSPEETSIAVVIQTTPPRLILEDYGLPIDALLETAPDLDALLATGQMRSSGMGLSLIKSLCPDALYHVAAEHPAEPCNRLCIPLPEINRPRIMIIDDDITQLAVLESYLAEHYHTSLFSNPAEALKSLRQTPFDLIICDINMPEINGFQLREQVRSIRSARLLPFIFLTGETTKDLLRQAAFLRIDDFVSKPVNKSMLENTIERVLLRVADLRDQISSEFDAEVTHSLWNTLPKTYGGYQLDAAYQVAARGGGDFIFSSHREHSLIVILGDVMGHGDQGKFFTYALSGYLHGMCMACASGQSVTELLSQLSEGVRTSQVLGSTILTCMVIELFADGTITLASGGHPAPWVISADGHFREVGVGGMLPGLSEDAQYDAVSLTLTPGESLLLYTDGLVEQGMDMKTDIVNSELETMFRELPPRQGATWLLNRVLKKAGAASDDMTLISISLPEGAD
ncbi:response regulator receiver-modulated signal transduction histidine kinase/sigma factor PP2C-like phosphatase [Oleiphilus messinensis]|uniref:Response regulator receiver-modulated signal transduction histidine kinase/sigma factor PP2C-like phosphatase n=1 Tax=Oleiphilus messinensis TaxID=141451 RepID=A0A1Y0I618_9GAMM|nr:SpoIIE family protein phosphatase [Oleiphilus messinensis]ARU55236.1 response regulator receiver-modulated signal transduction histidine kinase/sigma factor PP2C-like phosphatase [Oleiphilus messinensis]